LLWHFVQGLVEKFPDVMPKNSDSHISYNRSFLITLGGLLLTLPVWIWEKEGDRSKNWPLFAWVLLCGLPFFGIVLLMIGALASNRRIDSTMHIPASGAGLLIMLLAMPVYFVLNAFKRKK
jgi:hypothetical protein